MNSTVPVLNAENTLAFVQNAYSTIDRMHLSMTTLAVIALVVTLAFMFAVREVAAWFFKIDDLKKDIRNLEGAIGDLQEQIRSLNSNEKSAEKIAPLTDLATTRSKRAEQFPIQH